MRLKEFNEDEMGQYVFENDYSVNMSSKLSGEGDVSPKVIQFQCQVSCDIVETVTDIPNVVNDAVSGEGDIFHGLYKAFANPLNNFWTTYNATGLDSHFSTKLPSALTPQQLQLFLQHHPENFC